MTDAITLPLAEAKELLRALRSCQAGAMIKAEEMLIAALAQQAEQVQPVSWNLKYKDSTPKLNVMNSAFEDWYQQQPFAIGPNKQLCRDSYAAGMGDPLVSYVVPREIK